MASSHSRSQRTYDHRLRDLVRVVGDPEIAAGFGLPRSTPMRLTAVEILTMKEMVESSEHRHIPTGRLAILAQRLGRVFAAPATWYKLVRE